MTKRFTLNEENNMVTDAQGKFNLPFNAESNTNQVLLLNTVAENDSDNVDERLAFACSFLQFNPKDVMVNFHTLRNETDLAKTLYALDLFGAMTNTSDFKEFWVRDNADECFEEGHSMLTNYYRFTDEFDDYEVFFEFTETNGNVTLR